MAGETWVKQRVVGEVEVKGKVEVKRKVGEERSSDGNWPRLVFLSVSLSLCFLFVCLAPGHLALLCQ